MPEEWPVFFRFDQAYRLLPSFETPAEVVSRYPDEDDMVASGWLLGDEFLREQANVVSFEVGDGTAVTMGSQIAFRTQTRATFKLLFNAIFHGPAEPGDGVGAGNPQVGNRWPRGVHARGATARSHEPSPPTSWLTLKPITHAPSGAWS